MSLMELLTKQLGGGGLSQISKALGSDEKTTENAVGAALPMLLAALSRNAKSDDGASALANALSKDHDGGILDDLSGFLGRGGDKSTGDGILKHILGGKRNTVETGISRSTGLDQDATNKLMAMLAPVVMGGLGKTQKESGLDARGLAALLQGQAQEIEKKEPRATSFITKMLDQDGDGDLDLGDLAKGFLGKFMGR